jgi:integrin alpha 11
MLVLKCVFPVPPGYAVTSVVSARSGRLLVAGAPRFNHTGKVIIFTLKNTGNLTILHSLKGQQVYSTSF